MADYTEKEKYRGTNHDGMEISFNRAWAGHRFTDEECEALLAGKEIACTDFVSKKGSRFGARGILCQQEYNGHKYWGFKRTGFLDGGIPDSWSGHEFTQDEKDSLEAGCVIRIEDAVSKRTGKTFSCGLKYACEEDGAEKKLIPVFD